MISRIITVLALGLGSALSIPAQAGSVIEGTWKYDGFHYDGHRYPNPNPDLTLLFTFYGRSSSHLIWFRANESGFCERKGIFEIRENENLYQKVTWVNPANLGECGRDPDMQLHRETTVRFGVTEHELHLFLDLNGKEFIYILRRCGSPGTQCLNPPENSGTSPNI